MLKYYIHDVCVCVCVCVCGEMTNACSESKHKDTTKTFFTPKQSLPIWTYIMSLLLVAAISVCVLVDLHFTSVEEQMTGVTKVPRAVYITLCISFFVTGVAHGFTKWWYWSSDVDVPASVENMNWNFTTFFTVSFLLFLFLVITDALDKLFLLAVVILLQVVAGIWLILFSMFEQYRYHFVHSIN